MHNLTLACADLTWRKSSRSTDTGQCVELAAAADRIAVRDSKGGPSGPVIVVTRRALGALVDEIKSGDLDA